MPTLEENGKIFTGKGAKSEDLTLKLGNRHGFITGATGIDKTMTLQVPRKDLLAPRFRCSPPT